jgi:hypothetical protein
MSSGRREGCPRGRPEALIVPHPAEDLVADPALEGADRLGLRVAGDAAVLVVGPAALVDNESRLSGPGERYPTLIDQQPARAWHLPVRYPLGDSRGPLPSHAVSRHVRVTTSEASGADHALRIDGRGLMDER